MEKKTHQGPTLKTIIRKYLNEDCFIEAEHKHENHEFVFEVKYPKLIDEKGNHRGRVLAISREKKKNYLKISNKILFNEEDLKIIHELDDSQKGILIREIRFFLISQNLLQSVNFEKNEIYFSDNIYFNGSAPPMINDLYQSIKKIINSQIVVMDILNRSLGILNSNKISLEGKDSYYQ
ncbi:MAG: hypothetical protein ACFE96_17455 [Candidatus Hermodarchaeota archaeon]